MKKRIFIVLVFFILNSVGFATIQRSYNEIQKLGVLRVGATGDYAPVTYWSPEQKKYMGFDIDMAKSLAKYLNLKIKFIKTSWQTLSKDLLNGKFDIAVGGITATKQRSQNFIFSDPIMNTGKVLLILKKNKEKFRGLDDVDKAGNVAVANNGGTNMQFALANIKNADIIIVPENFMNFKYLLSGKADAFFTDKIEALYKEKNNSKYFAVNPEKPYDEAYKVYLIPKANKELQQKVNQWLKITINDGNYDKFLTKALNTKYR